MERLVPMERTKSSIDKQQELISSFANTAKSRDIEVMFGFDSTASMMPYIDEVRRNLKETISKLAADIPSIKIGVMAVGDYGNPEYAVSKCDLTTDIDAIVKFVDNVKAANGRDIPECYELALREAKMASWTPQPHVNKAFVIIGDSHPHSTNFTSEKISWRKEVQALTKNGIKIYGVQANSNVKSKVFFTEIAEMSGGVHMDLKKLDLVTDMFKAVCYREFGGLETYREEVTREGRMDEGMKDMFNQLDVEGAKPSTQIEKRANYDWYIGDGECPVHFIYDPSTNKWTPTAAEDKKEQRRQKKKEHKKEKRKNRKKRMQEKTKEKEGQDKETEQKEIMQKKAKEPEKKKEKKNEQKKKEEMEKGKEMEKQKEKKGKEKKEKDSEKQTKAIKEEKKKNKGDDKGSKKRPAEDLKDAKKAKKVKKESEEEKAPLKKAESILVGNGEWKRDRFGRMASLRKAD